MILTHPDEYVKKNVRFVFAAGAFLLEGGRMGFHAMLLHKENRKHSQGVV